MNRNLNFDEYQYQEELPDSDSERINEIAPSTSTKDLATPYEGFLKGNLFNSTYSQYKDYQPLKLVPNNEQAELLLNIDQLDFAAHDINLFLDIYPNDQQMIELFNKYTMMTNDALKAYENKYGPLTTTAQSNKNSFSWVETSWPWDMGE